MCGTYVRVCPGTNLLVLGGLILMLAGCNTANQPYPVHGTIVDASGKPVTELAGGSVSFSSEELKTSSSGKIEEDGTFRLSTLKENDGALPGKYRVTISPPDVGTGETKKPKQVIDPRYENAENSALEATVEQKNNEVTLTVERLKGKR